MELTLQEEFIQQGYGNQYDGFYKSLTSCCSSCRFYMLLDEQERCYWGVAWKVLVQPTKPRRCQLHDKPSPREEAYKRSLSARTAWQETLEHRVGKGVDDL